jgi:hypothetical protein
VNHLARQVVVFVVVIVSMSAVRRASAQSVAPEPRPTQKGADTPVNASSTSNADFEKRMIELEEQNRRLREDLDRIKEDAAFTQKRVDQVMPITGRLTGYVDFGFFAVQGDGSGIRPDIGNRRFPEYADQVPGTWVFMGDPLSTAVNSRGEPADTGDSRAVAFDAIKNGGKPSFILNAINLSLFAGIGETVTLNGMFDLVPRSRNVSNAEGLFLGDFVDVKLGYAEYIVPTKSIGLSIYAGKFDSVLGREYRSQEAPDRLGVTPSLICRYTCGRPLGLKVRLKVLDDALVLNAAVTNGSHGIEGFPFYNEIDTNKSKTVAGRVSYKFQVGSGVELGASSSYGAQDFQTDDSVAHWHYGFDLHADWNDIDFTAEFVQGRAPGKSEPGAAPCGVAPCLRYKGAYAQVGYRVNNWLIPYVRGDWRDALHQSGASFVYISDLARVTPGIRLELGTSVILKAEYTINRELGRLPQIPNDVFTSSLVVKY